MQQFFHSNAHFKLYGHSRGLLKDPTVFMTRVVCLVPLMPYNVLESWWEKPLCHNPCVLNPREGLNKMEWSSISLLFNYLALNYGEKFMENICCAFLIKDLCTSRKKSANSWVHYAIPVRLCWWNWWCLYAVEYGDIGNDPTEVNDHRKALICFCQNSRPLM